jgi:gluconolactonase
MEILDDQGRTIEGVYRIDPDGQVTRVIGREVERANGVLVSADDRFLYVADNNNNTVGGAHKLWRFDLRKDGTVDLASRKLLFDWRDSRGPDGLKQDQKGRLYVAAGLTMPKSPFEPGKEHKGGVYVFVKTLYITAGGTLHSIRTTTPGRVVWPKGK